MSPSSNIDAADMKPSMSVGSVQPTQNISTTTIYGKKPEWGWDYAFLFPVDDSLHAVLPALLSRSVTVPAEAVGEEFAEQGHLARGSSADEKTRLRIEILSRLKSAGFVFSQLYSRSENVIMVRFSLPLYTMKQNAARLCMKFELKEKYGSGYLEYDLSRSSCYVNDHLEERSGSYFCPSDRILIILRTLQSKEDWGCDLNIEKMVFKKQMRQAFAIHSPPDQDALIRSSVWARVWDPAWTPPFRQMKDYLGARVALYFAFVSFYACKLKSIALLSFPVFFLLTYLPPGRLNDSVKWFFSIALVLWATNFIEGWKCRNAAVALDWGLNDYRDDAADETRPQFKGERRAGFYCPGGFVSLADLASSHNYLSVSHVVDEGEGGPLFTGGTVAMELDSLPSNSFEDKEESQRRQIQSLSITTFVIVIVASITVLSQWFRNEIVCFSLGFNRVQCTCLYSAACNVVAKPRLPHILASAVPGVLNGVLITIFDAIWYWASLYLTQRENHRTDQMFENSLVYKRFAFQFISNYLSLFYIAFMKKWTASPCRMRQNILSQQMEQDCMGELESQMIALVLTKATVQQIAEVGAPYFMSSFSRWHARRLARKQSETPAELPDSRLKTTSATSRYFQESKLPPYHSTVDDYAELAIQFGYLSLFGLAFPLAAVVNLLNNLVEVRTDAFKILRLSQRVNADDAADIGAWYPILEGLNILSLVTNAGILVYTAETGNNLFRDAGGLQSVHKFLTFFLIWHVLLAIKGAAAFSKSSTLAALKRKYARQGYDIARFFDVGWQSEFRGSSPLHVQDEEVRLCIKYADLFDTASDNESTAQTVPEG